MSISSAKSALGAVIASIRERRPLLHCMTSPVVANWTANVLLSTGASPLMARAGEEIDPVCRASHGLSLNLGMLEAEGLAAMLQAARRMADLGKPVVLDPVGIGVSAWRMTAARRLLETRPRLIRANAGEIAGLLGGDRPGAADSATMSRGTDSLADPVGLSDAARAYAARSGFTVAMTGAGDVITDGRRLARISGGTALITSITGGGCALSALAAAAASVEPDPYLAGLAACAYYKGATALAAARARGPGTLAVELLDALAGADPAAIFAMVEMEGDI